VIKYFFSITLLLLVYADCLYSKAIAIDRFSADKLLENDTVKLQGVDTTSFKYKLDKFNNTMEKIVKYSPLPVISYSTETDWLLGLTKINSFRIGAKSQTDITIQPSTITALAYFTLKNQYKFALTAKLMFDDNKYKSFTEILFINFPEYYFGIGNETIQSDSCLVVTKNFSFTQSFSYQLTKHWYIGAKYIFKNYSKVDTVGSDNNCNLDISDLSTNEGVQSGFGFQIAHERRDNRFNAKRGSYAYFEYLNYGELIGSDFTYSSIILEYRKYITPLKWLTLAGQIYTEGKFGNVPIQSLALMGGDNMMRGIYNGRFRDHTMITSQFEARIPLFWIIGGVVFTGLGEVAPKYGDYNLQGIKWTYGAGLRLMVDQSTRVNMRFDMGFFDGNSLFFFTFSEAF